PLLERARETARTLVDVHGPLDDEVDSRFSEAEPLAQPSHVPGTVPRTCPEGRIARHADHRRLTQGPPDRRPEGPHDAADVRPRARERLQPRADAGSPRGRPRPLRRLGRYGDR